VVEVATPPLIVSECPTCLEWLIWLVEAEREESVLHIALRHSSRACQNCGGNGWKFAVLYPGNFVYISVGGRANNIHINIRLTAARTVAPLALTSNMVPTTISEGGAPGDPVISVHQGTAGVLLVLIVERKNTGRVGGSSAYSDAARRRFRINRSDINLDAALGAADPPIVRSLPLVG